jgi:ubiquinone/menaquinone biosynthesis C-methylase UbiE
MQERSFAECSRRVPNDGRVLDLCCGPGRLGRRIRADHPAVTVTGVDMAHGALLRAKEAIGVARAAANRLPFVDRTFSTSVISGALYLVEDPVGVIAEMARVTRGKVLVLEASPKVNVGTALDPRADLDVKERADYLLWIAAMRLSRRFEPRSLSSCLASAGLTDVVVEDVAGGLYHLASGTVPGPTNRTAT